MGTLDDTAIFAAIVQQGGFSHAAKHLGLSNGMISRRIAQLESNLGVTLIKRTTRQIHLTPEGELFWQHARRIQQELESAISLIQSSAKKPKGVIRISAPLYFGRHYLTPILTKFLADFKDIEIDLMLSNQKLDPIKSELDLMIRGAGYSGDTTLPDSTMQMKLLFEEEVGLYASEKYLLRQGNPKDVHTLSDHTIIHYSESQRLSQDAKWHYQESGKSKIVTLKPAFNCNDIESSLTACIDGFGIAKFTQLNVRQSLAKQLLRPILEKYNWGQYHLHVIYPHQKALPQRTRLLLDFINVHMKHLM